MGETGNTCYPTVLTLPEVLRRTVGAWIKLLWMSRSTGEQNKVVVNQKKLKAAVWKENTEIEIPSLSQQEVSLGGVMGAS